MDNNNTHMGGEKMPPSAPNNNALMAVLAYLGILIIVPFLTDAKNDPFVKFHIKQGLVLIICWVISWFIAVIPVLGWFVSFVVNIILVVFMIMGIVNAATGKMKELPWVGKYGNSLHI